MSILRPRNIEIKIAASHLHLVLCRFVRTPILDQGIQDFLDGKGVGFATVDDACTAMLKIASDTTVNGMFNRGTL
jgi:hypothetical protein